MRSVPSAGQLERSPIRCCRCGRIHATVYRRRRVARTFELRRDMLAMPNAYTKTNGRLVIGKFL